MKSVAKQRGDRYPTADALAADIRRHLQDEPIEARRPSIRDRAMRLVRRHKAAVGLTASFLLICVLAGTLLVNRMAQRRQRLARERTLPAIEHLISLGEVVDAFRLAETLQGVLANDPQFVELWDRLTVSVNVDIHPSDTKVFIRDWDGSGRRLAVDSSEFPGPLRATSQRKHASSLRQRRLREARDSMQVSRIPKRRHDLHA